MSIKRYYISGLHPHIWEHPEGEMVYFEDYVTLKAENARLKAEVERLGAFRTHTIIPNEMLKAEVERLDILCKQLMKQHSDISCENIMLRKAGDAMVLKLPDMMAGVVKAEESIGLMNDWIAAKEGKPSV
jgi:hypothetical protein